MFKITLIPSNKPFFDDTEIEYATASIQSGNIAGDGPFGRKLENKLSDYLECKHALLVNSCTSAIEISLFALGIGPGDEVICPSFGFVSVANAILQCGAKPVFAEIDYETMNLDPAHTEKQITTRTRAIILIHYAGMSCDLVSFSELKEKHGLYLIEDAAQALGSKLQGKALGTFGDSGCFSLHETKNLTCGEGGIFVTNDDNIAQQAEIIREKGTNRSSFLRREVQKYTWVGRGSSYILSDILAAVALAQFEKIEPILSSRTKIAEFYQNAFAPYNYITPPTIPDGCKPNWHLFALRINKLHRDIFLEKLKSKGIGASFHFVPLHSAPYSKTKLKGGNVSLPVTDRVASELIRIPIYPQLSNAEKESVVSSMEEVAEELGLE
ncbi:MAG: dTDP-4-amino-4,6-dideoxygalactose transaminase [Opitutae bacterium]|nr:dTDP-4-amino-4,6-dideoxygalactose transaminase [Opitutae bacterium]